MKKFKIFGFVNGKPILITDSEFLSPGSTYDETFKEGEHMKTTLSFKMYNKLDDGSDNPLIKYVYSGAKIRLLKYYKENGEWKYRTYDHIVNSINDEFYQKGIEHSISCEDYASWKFAKEGSGLDIEYTGTIREVTQELLVVSKKNLGYKGININYFKPLSFKEKTSNLFIINGVIKKQGSAAESITYQRSQDLKSGLYYVQGNLFNGTVATISFVQYNSNGIEIQRNSVTTNAQGLFNITSEGETLELRSICTQYKIEVNSTTDISIGDFSLKIKPNLELINKSLHIDQSGGIIDEDFKSKSGSTNYFQKITLKLEGSNLYNGLIEIANLFDALLYFNYANEGAMTFGFVKRDKKQYKGYRLSPDFNIANITRDESVDEFITVLHIQGNEDVYSIFPPMPSEFKDYFLDCIENDFTNVMDNQTILENYFEDFSVTTYSDLIPIVESYITATNDNTEKEKAIEDFALAADLVPNLENTIYNINYFYNIGVLNQEDYDYLLDVVQNKLRVLNIKLRLYTELYYQIESLLSAQDSEISFLARNLTTEKLALESWFNQIADDPEKYEIHSDSWISIQNRITESIAEAVDNSTELMSLMAIIYDDDYIPQSLELEETSPGEYKLKKDSYPYNLLNIDGYYNIQLNGIKQKIINLENTIQEELNNISEYQSRLAEIDLEIASNPGKYTLNTLEVEKAGLERQIKMSVFLIGKDLDNPIIVEENNSVFNDMANSYIKGELQHKLEYLEFIYDKLQQFGYRPTLIDYKDWDTFDVTSTWTFTGSISKDQTKTIDNSGVNDIMLKFNSGYTSTLTAPALSGIDETKLYRFSCLMTSDGLITSNITINIRGGESVLNITPTQLGGANNWIGIELFSKDIDGFVNDIYNLPTYESVDGTISHTFGTNTNNLITITKTGTAGNLYFYRPRFEEVSNFMPSLDEMFSLLDNPKMVDYTLGSGISIDLQEGLNDLLFNYTYEGNLNRLKSEWLAAMYDRREDVLIEGYYENIDEIDSAGLLEQALVAMETYKFPRIGYSTTILDLSALEDFRFLNLEVADKILISELEDTIYKSYANTSTKYLDVEEINYDLRAPENTTIVVKKDNEATRIIQQLISRM